ncbi:MAG: hypothetical protein AABY18_01225 [Candidatus Thermoplasmatota archaeon]
MSRKGWSTISIPTELYDDVKRHVPVRAQNVPDYVRHWVRVGVMLDDLRATHKGFDEVLGRILAELEGGRRP